MNNINSTITYISHQWQLSNLRPLVPSTNNYIALVYSEIYKTDVVLKVLLANTHEPEALMLFDGNGCVRLLDYDPAAKCLLLEYIKPGITLKTFFPDNDETAIEITSQLIKKIHAKNVLTTAIGFKTIDEWLSLLHTFKSNKIAATLLTKAQILSKQLLSLKQELYLLHGDLHHENILQSSLQGWIAIDPKGVIGPLEYEVGRFIMNPIPDLLQQPDAKKIIQHRIDKFSQLFGFDRQRLVDWAFVQAVLSACWTEEGGSEVFFTYFVAFAKTIESL